MPTNRKTHKTLGCGRVIQIFGEIDEKLSKEVIDSLIKLDKKNGKDVLLLIDSNGGDLDATISIYQITKLLRCNIATLALSTASSAAAILLACGSRGKRMVMNESIIMLHDISSELSSDYHKVLVNELKSLDISKKIVSDLLVQHSDAKTVKLLKPEATYILGPEAVKLGLADVVINSVEDLYKVANI